MSEASHGMLLAHVLVRTSSNRATPLEKLKKITRRKKRAGLLIFVLRSTSQSLIFTNLCS